jgi:GntR family transcriptional regulator
VRVARADEQLAPMLGVSLMEPILHLRSEGYLDDRRPIRLTENYFREGRYEYTAEMLWQAPRPTSRVGRHPAGNGAAGRAGGAQDD